MGFMKGLVPRRRTLEYLNSGALRLRKQINVFVLAYHPTSTRSQGAKDFHFWHWSQLIHQNPDVQCLRMIHNLLTPNPYIQCFLQDGRKVTLDMDWLDRQQIHNRVQRTLGKTQLSDQIEQMESAVFDRTPCFGSKFDRHCMCEVQGQHPCTGQIPAPQVLTGVWRWNKNVRAE